MFDPTDPSLEGPLRLGAFASVLLVMALAEALLPRRKRNFERGRRWATNLIIAGIDTLALRLLFPIAAIGTAFAMQAKGFGLFNLTGWPAWLEGLIAFLALDFAIYVQHVASHKIPVLWRLHQVHHTDRDIDVTTAIRFHPVEIVLSMLYKMGIVALIGAPPLAVFLFEVVLNACAMFNHANLNLPRRVDALLRLVLVTPDMHRVHHSTEWRETDSNYGFNLSVWDRLFSTYVPQPRRGHDGMVIGLGQYQTDEPTRLGWSLLLPFRSKQVSRN